MFKWKNRKFCLYRIQLLVACKRMDLDRAIHTAIHFIHPRRSEHEYCFNPDQITGHELTRLRNDAATYIQHCKDYQKRGKAEQLTINWTA